MKKIYFGILLALVVLPIAFASQSIKLKPVSTYKTGVFDDGACEIVSYDKESKRVFIVNGASATIDILNIANPSAPVLVKKVDLTPYGKQANSVSAKNGIMVAAVENNNKQANGKAVFFDINGNYLNSVTVGALPDMITFSPDGEWVLVANEGEPNDAYTVDPEGSISVIKVKDNIAKITQNDVRTVDFKDISKDSLDESIRVYGPGSTVAQDFEPEYIAVSKNSKTAWITLQENNAMCQIDIKDASIIKIVGLGYKDYSSPHNVLDASNKDGYISLRNWPVKGMFQPDSVSMYKSEGKEYVVTANEGDSRDYPGYSEEKRVKDLVLDTEVFPNATYLQDQANLGRLKISTVGADKNNDGKVDQLYAYGTRSFTIWSTDGELIYDSMNDFERITAAYYPLWFNSDADSNDSFDSRSDDKGPEPEALTIGKIDGKTYAFIGLERMGGIMVYDITNPEDVNFVQYLNTRDYSGDPLTGTAGDLAPEGFCFISAEDSPNGKALLVAAFEVSGTTTIFEIE
jgi:hypothetical protein